MFWNKLANLLRRTQPNTERGATPLLPNWGAGQAVTEDTAYTYSAYWCCVRVISETIAQLPWHIHERTPRGNRIADQHPADALIYRAPNKELDAAVWRELMVRHCLTWGNAYSEIERDTANRSIALWPLDPARVMPFRDQGQLWYMVAEPSGGQSYVPAADMLHFRGLGDDLMGWSVLAYAARTLGLALAQEDSMASQMKNGARLSGILSPPGGGTLPADRRKSIMEEWQQANTGSKNHGRVYLLSQGLDYRPLSMPNTDAQLLESRRLSILDICRFMRVPPHMAFDLERATFSNIAHQHLEFGIHTIGPWVTKLEQQVNRKLISPANQRRYYSKMRMEAVLRSAPADRAEVYTKLRDLGAVSPNASPSPSSET